MGTTPLTSTKMKREAEAILAAAGTATVAGAGNGIVISCKKGHKLVLLLSAVGATDTMTVKAGIYPAAALAGEGDYTTAAAGAAGAIIALVVESGRHLQNAAGVSQFTVEFNVSAGKFWAIEVPA